MKHKVLATLALLLGVGFVTAHSAPPTDAAADLIYTGGDIVTMNDKQP